MQIVRLDFQRPVAEMKMLQFSPMSVAAKAVLAKVVPLLDQANTLDSKPNARARSLSSQLQWAGPIPIHSIPMTQLRHELPLKNSRPVYWRFLAVRGNKAMRLVDLKKQSGKYALAALTAADAATWEAVLGEAERLLEERDQVFRVRAVVFQPLQVRALWLKPVRGTNSLFFPIVPSYHPLYQSAPLSESAFFSKIQELLKAQRRQFRYSKPNLKPALFRQKR
jgi:hypothetical protein